MAVTQYIGARYVPKIFQNPDDNSNDWKAGIAYEPLTIVSYAGGSYTSKSDVPASVGNPTDNPAYWVAIGLYSGQTAINTNSINQIRYAIATHSEAGTTCTEHRDEGDFLWIEGVLYQTTAEINVNDTYTEGINITQVSDIMAGLDAALAQMASDISDCGNDIIAIQGDITNIQGDITELSDSLFDPYVITVGDSYAQGYDPNGNNSGWPVYLQNLGVNVINLCEGGAAFKLTASDTRAPLYQLQNATVPPTAQVMAIVACLGYNDFGGTSTDIIDNIHDFINYCATNYPKATVYIGMCGYAWTHNADNKYGAQIVQTARDYMSACDNYKAVFMPQVLGCLLPCNGLSNADYKHPNETGNRTIANAIYAALHNEEYSCNGMFTFPLTDNNVGFSASLFMDLTVTNGEIKGYARLDNAELDNSGTPVTIYNGIDPNPAHFPCMPFVRFQVNEILHNLDKPNSNVDKNYLNAPLYIYRPAYTSLGDVPIRINELTVAGNDFAKLSHFAYDQGQFYGEVHGSFV